MKILAISGSPRVDRMVHTTLKQILHSCKDEYEVISLSGKKISGCTSCLACVKDNVCVLSDDWNIIAEKMVEADVIIFGCPNYYGLPNGISHCFLERTYSFRHNGKFPLRDKKVIIVTTKRLRDNDEPVADIVSKFMISNKMNIIGKMNCIEYSTCYTCGHGKNCGVGSVVAVHGSLQEILPCHLPKEIDEQESTQLEIKRMRELLIDAGVSF